MFFDNELSSIPQGAPFLAPDNKYVNHIWDWELGGVGLNNPVQGLMYQYWQCHLYINQLTLVGTVTIEAPNWPESLLFSLPGVSDISFTFDQNMNPFVAFTQNGQARFWWFDTIANQMTFTDLGPTDRTPRCSLDDKRPVLNLDADIILGYMRGDTLYFRMQRDRYLIEYLLETGLTGDLVSVGMNTGYRFQFAIGFIE